MKLRVLVHYAEEGGYWAEIPALPGCVSEGETYEETMANIHEAAEGWLAVAIEQSPAEDQVQIAESSGFYRARRLKNISGAKPNAQRANVEGSGTAVASARIKI